MVNKLAHMGIYLSFDSDTIILNKLKIMNKEQRKKALLLLIESQKQFYEDTMYEPLLEMLNEYQKMLKEINNEN